VFLLGLLGQTVVAQQEDKIDKKDDLPELPPTRVEGDPSPSASSTSGAGQSFPSGGNLPADVAVTPTRTESPLREFGGSVSIINSAQIINSQQSFARDLLQTVPGLDFIQNGGPGRTASVFLRGQSSRATKVLVDGIPVNDPASPQRTFDFGTLSTLEIDRIEVLRGPQSTLYGSDAVGGVINIITKRGEGPTRAWLSSMGGEFGTSENIGHISGGSKVFYYSAGASWYDTNGFSVANQYYDRPFNTEDDGYRQGTYSTRFGWTPCENFDVDVVLRYLNGTTQLDSFNRAPFFLINDDLLTSTRTEQFYGRASARLSLFDGNWENRVAYNRAVINRDFDDPNSAFPPTYTLFHGLNEKFEYQGNVRLWHNNRFTYGFDYLNEEFDNPPSQPTRRSQTDSAFYLQDHIGIADRWFTTAGIRWDNYEFAGLATTWRVASVLRIDETFSAIHGSYGTGFIAPSLFELFAELPPFVIGNPKLRPESSRGYEVGFEQGFFGKNLILDVTYFRIASEDLIQYVFPTYENVAQAESSGIEAIATAKLGQNTTLVANYTYTEAVDLENDRLLPFRPRHKGSVTLNHSFLNGRANWYTQLVAIGERFDYAVPKNLQLLAPYTVVNTALWYDVNPNFRLFGRIDNLFDTNYEDQVGYGTAGFSVYAGAKITFGGGRERRGLDASQAYERAEGTQP